MEEMRNSYKIIRKSKGRRQRGRPRCRWEDIRTDLREIGWEGANWMNPVQDRDWWQAVVNMVMNIGVP
jgi:hypothetical protein